MTPVHHNSSGRVKIILGLGCLGMVLISPYWRAELRGDYNYVCGDSIVDPYVGETCDPPGTVVGPGGNICRDDCTFCGDASIDVGEACDDGNGVSGDGCENDCSLTCDPAPIATLRFTPGTLNKQSQGMYIKATIEVPAPYSLRELDSERPIQLAIDGAAPIFDLERRIAGNQLKVSFSRDDATALAPVGDSVEFEISGTLSFGCEFSAVDYVRVIDQGAPHPSDDDPSTILDNMIRGEVHNLGHGEDGSLGSVVCLVNYLSNADFGLNTDFQIPVAGEAYFYLFESCGSRKRCSYGVTSAGNERVQSNEGCAGREVPRW